MSGIEKFYAKERNITIFRRNFLSRPEKLRWGTLRYIRKVGLSKNIMTERLISLFSADFFSRILPIKFLGEPLCVSEPLGHRKLLCSERGDFAIFRCFSLALQY